jgi:hypothetical protein
MAPVQGPLLGHAELVHRLCLADMETGAAVAGNRGYYLLGEGVMLNQVGGRRNRVAARGPAQYCV